jgi:protein O-mannosyl-transferase
MTNEFRATTRWPFASLASLAALLAVTWLLYSSGFNARWMFDDLPNLAGLTGVNDFNTALEFVFGGISSQTGRPVAMLTFLLNLSDWPDNPAGFRIINGLIHLANGALVFLITTLLMSQQAPARKHATNIAIVVAGLWLLSPFLASTVLSAIQRMALLSAFFMLLGFAIYLYGRIIEAASPIRSLSAMSLGVIVGLGLGVLAKENAAIFPILILITELTLLRNLRSSIASVPLHMWRFLFLFTPIVALTTHSIFNWDGHAATYLARDFSASERISTQTVILWDYLRQAFFPDISRLGFFHDDAEVVRAASPQFIAAAIGWIAVLAFAFFKRKSSPVFLFAVCWFLGNHLLESTWFPLELYFEHRNYVALVGPILALVFYSWTWASMPIARALPILLIPLQALMLYSVTSLWGNPNIAAEIWADAHPRSSRATQFLAQQYVLNGDPVTAAKVVLRGSEVNPQASDLAVQSIQLNCGILGPTEMRSLFNDVAARSSEFRLSLALPDAVHRLIPLIENGECQGISRSDLRLLTTKLLQNDAVRHSNLVRQHLYHALGTMDLWAGDFPSAIVNLDSAFRASPNPETAVLIASLLVSAGGTKDALAFLDEAAEKAPRSRWRRGTWERTISQFVESLGESGDMAESHDDEGGGDAWSLGFEDSRSD